MIIDFHTHTFPEKIAARAVEGLSRSSHTVPFADGTDRGLAASMKEAGVDRSVVLPVATYPEQAAKINESIQRMKEEREELGLISFGAMHPDAPDWERNLERVKELGLPGIKVHPVYQGVDIDDARYVRIAEKCGELGLIFITHAGWDIGFPGERRCSPAQILHFLEESGILSGRNSAKIVLAHMGGWREWRDVMELLVDTPVLLDCSFSEMQFTPTDDGYWDGRDTTLLSEDQFLEMLEAFTSKRILFGTDSPWSSQEEMVGFIKELPVSDAEKEDILGANAERLLGLRED